MGRTRLRGVELAGTRIAIEVPRNLDWQWPSARHRLCAASTEGADVHVGVRVGAIPAMPGRGFVYESASHRFEVAPRRDGWIVAVHGRSGCERVAVFDDGFAEGEVIVAPAAAAAGVAPLEHPLDELVALHRLTRRGGLVVRGATVLREGSATVYLGSSRSASNADGAASAEIGPQRLAGDRLAVLPTDDGARLLVAPWNARELAARARLRIDCFHLVSAAHAVVADRLGRDDAVTALLAHAVAPVYDECCADRLFDAAARLCDRVPLLRVGLPEARRVPSLGWGQGWAAATPASAPIP